MTSRGVYSAVRGRITRIPDNAMLLLSLQGQFPSFAHRTWPIVKATLNELNNEMTCLRCLYDRSWPLNFSFMLSRYAIELSVSWFRFETTLSYLSNKLFKLESISLMPSNQVLASTYVRKPFVVISASKLGKCNYAQVDQLD